MFGVARIKYVWTGNKVKVTAYKRGANSGFYPVGSIQSDREHLQADMENEENVKKLGLRLTPADLAKP